MDYVKVDGDLRQRLHDEDTEAKGSTVMKQFAFLVILSASLSFWFASVMSHAKITCDDAHFDNLCAMQTMLIGELSAREFEPTPRRRLRGAHRVPPQDWE